MNDKSKQTFLEANDFTEDEYKVFIASLSMIKEANKKIHSWMYNCYFLLGVLFFILFLKFIPVTNPKFDLYLGISSFALGIFLLINYQNEKSKSLARIQSLPKYNNYLKMKSDKEIADLFF